LATRERDHISSLAHILLCNEIWCKFTLLRAIITNFVLIFFVRIILAAKNSPK
jgi:hypothetical protein